jgi:hypothetical protein
VHRFFARDRVIARRGAGVLATLGAAALLCACGSASAGGSVATKTLSEADKGRTVTVARGTHIVLRLHNTYWRIRGSSNSAVVRQTGAQKVLAKSGCLPGVGCGTVTAPFRAVGAGKAQLTAARKTCGEALRCTGGRGRFVVTIRVTS